jgi:hypothetical protein
MHYNFQYLKLIILKFYDLLNNGLLFIRSSKSNINMHKYKIQYLYKQ